MFPLSVDNRSGWSTEHLGLTEREVSTHPIDSPPIASTSIDNMCRTNLCQVDRQPVDNWGCESESRQLGLDEVAATVSRVRGWSSMTSPVSTPRTYMQEWPGKTIERTNRGLDCDKGVVEAMFRCYNGTGVPRDLFR